MAMKRISIMTAAGRQRFYRDESGSDLLEFALSAVLLLTILFGIMDCARAVYVNHFLAQAAREGSRYASVRGAAWSSACATITGASCIASSANISNYVASTVTAGISPGSLTTTTTWPGTDANGNNCSGTNAQNCLVTVQVSYNFKFVLPFLPTNALSMSSTSSATVLQ
jgi:Flp pilus assembly protein TadG